MYDHFVGEVTRKAGTVVVLRCGGVGYELKVPLTTAGKLQVGAEGTLSTILHVTDGNPTLLGFAQPGERDLARMLLSVSGVGPTACLAILSTNPPATVVGAIQAGDAKTLQQTKGIGAKTAERLCIELRDRIGRLDVEGTPSPGADATELPAAAEDAVAALAVLGYPDKEARTKVGKAVEKAPDAGTEELIKLVLRG